MFQKQKKVFCTQKVVPAALTIVFLIFAMAPLQARADSAFLHTHTDACVQMQTVLCDYPHESYSSVETITRHCTYCGTQTAHSHYLTNYVCSQTGYRQTVAGSTACLTCHNAGYSWGANEFYHYREERVYICGAQQSAVVARVTLTSSQTELTNQDITLQAGVDIVNAGLAGSSFSYSWDNSNWSFGASRNVSENGTYTVWVKNGKGEIADVSVTVSNIDKISPVINSISHSTDGMTKDKIFVTVSASDENGIAGFSFDGGSTWQGDGGYWIQEGRTYQAAVKDTAGNITVKEIKRGDFPYPYTAPSPSPSSAVKPDETDRTETAQASKNPDTKTQKLSSGSEKEKNNTSPKETVTSGKEQEKQEKTTANGTKGSSVGLIPKITVSRNQLLNESVSGNGSMVSWAGITEQEENPNRTDREAETDKNEESGENTEFLQEVKDTRKKEFPLAACVIGLAAATGAAGYTFCCFYKSGILYIMEESEDKPFFRRLQRIRIQNSGNGYEITLPDYIGQSESGGHFRILLPKRKVEEGRNKRIFIYTGKRKLVADVEECIDFMI